MALLPLYGFVEGDTLGLLVLAYDDDTVGRLAERLTRAAALRVAPKPGARVVHAGRVLDPRVTLAAAGIEALDRVDLVRAPPPSEEAP